MSKLTGPLADPLWRIQNLYLIRDKKKQRRRVRFNPTQTRILNAVRDRLVRRQPIRHYDLKFRQGGVTTFWDLFYLDDAIFNENTYAAIVAQKKESLSHIWEIVRFAHATMPSMLQPKLVSDSTRVLAFPNGSKVMVSLKVQSTGIHSLHVSEYPLCDPEDIATTMAACPPNANITLEGVAEGMNHAYDMWLAGGDGFTRMFHPWFIQQEYRSDPAPGLVRTKEEERLAAMALREYGVVLDDRQVQYRRNSVKLLGRLFPQEMAEDPITCFLATGSPFFDNLKLQVTMVGAKAVEPIFRDGQRHERGGHQWWETEVWELPVQGNVYVAGADTARGYEATAGDPDYSVLAIINASTGRTAFRYKARVKKDQFAHECAVRCREYNNALLAVELPGPGESVVDLLLRVEKYGNLYSDGKGAEVSVSKGGLKSSKQEINYGFWQTANTKRVTLERFRIAIEGDFSEGPENFRPAVAMLDAEFLREAFKIRDEAGKIGAASGYHDDLTMAWSLAHEMFMLKRRTGEAQNGESRFIVHPSEYSRHYGQG